MGNDNRNQQYNNGNYYNNNSQNQYNANAQYRQPVRVCPRCGNADLLYETIQKKSGLSTALKILLGIIFIILLGPVGLMLSFELFTLALIIVPILGIVSLFNGSNISRKLGFESNGDLRITCKRCGQQINPYNTKNPYM